MHRWCGRAALVTGASSGIGRTIAVSLLRHGLNVIACARRVDALESITDEVKGKDAGQLLPIKCDVAKEEDVLTLFEKIKSSNFGGVDVCVNNAGYGILGKLSSDCTSDWRGMLDVNVLGLSICTREALKSMRERGVNDGHIIHISSMAAHSIVEPMPFYSATKCAVKALTEGLRMELLTEKSGIRVTEICPGVVKTDFVKASTTNQEFVDHMYSTMPFLLAEDVSSAVIYALSAPKHVQVHDVQVWPIGKPSLR